MNSRGLWGHVPSCRARENKAHSAVEMGPWRPQMEESEALLSRSREESRTLRSVGLEPGVNLGKESRVSTCFARVPRKFLLWNSTVIIC